MLQQILEPISMVEDALDMPALIKALRTLGIEALMPVQVKAIESGLLKSNNNIVVVAPTGSGKTLVGYMAMIKTFFEKGMGVYLVPLKSIASEKLEDLELVCGTLGCRACITTGDYDKPSEWLSECDFVVATYERFDSLLRLKPLWIRKIGTVVLDELHTVGDDERGHVVELVGVRSLREGYRIIGLSAATGNSSELAEWLNADLVYDDWRPVRLVEGYYDRSTRAIVFDDGRIETVRGDLEAHALREAYVQNYQVLVFKHSRQQAENLARVLADYSQEKCQDVLEEFLRREPPKVELDSSRYILSKCVAYHHAGLSTTTRKFVEELFRSRKIRAVVATPTLAAGVNLPARRVLVSVKRYEEGYMRGISVAEYKQMAGRAGRPGLDPYGEVVITDAKNREEVFGYIKGSPEPATSVLLSDRAVRIHTLSLLSSQDAETVEKLLNLLKLTLAFKQAGSALTSRVKGVLKDLNEWELISWDDGVLKPTKLGKTVSALYIDPLTAKIFVENLSNVKKAYDIYYLTLIAITPDFSRVRLGSTKSKELYTTMEILIESGNIPAPPWISEYDLLRATKAGLILRDWIEEVSEDTIAERYGVGVGDIAVLADTAQWLLYASGVICGTIGLSEHAHKLMTLSKRVESGVKDDALDLVRVRWIGRVRSRKLILADVKTIEDLSKMNPEKLAEILGIGLSRAEEILLDAKRLLSEKTELRKRV
ncbi:MAG: DEAD/DEAH box helicase [Sulfolobales archaeon]